MRKTKLLTLSIIVLALGYFTAILSERIVRNPQTAPYNVCVLGQVEPDCQRETGTKGLAYKGFPITTQKLFLVNDRWRVLYEVDLYGVPTLLINAGIFGALYAVAMMGVLKYAHTRH